MHRRPELLSARTRSRADDLLLRAMRGFWLPATLLFTLLPASRLSPLVEDARQILQVQYAGDRPATSSG